MPHPDLLTYKQLPVWRAQDIPAGFKNPHNTKENTWAKLEIFQGSLTFALCDERGNIKSTHVFTKTKQPFLIEPGQWHQIIESSDDVQCQLNFLCDKACYAHKKYDLAQTHSEVIAAMPYVTPGKTLDVGCGSGRNALYLALQGFTVDAVDLNPQSLAKLQYIKSQENLDTLTINPVDLNKPFQIKPAYDFILSTVVLMFLQRQSIQPLIEQMQKATKTGGHNLIVAAMDTHDYPCKAPFPFTFRPDELKNHYQDWTLIKYNEDVGHLHKKDECGNPIALRFATLLAKKVN